MILVNSNDILYVILSFVCGIGFLVLIVFLSTLTQKLATKKKLKKYDNLESEIYRIIYEQSTITHDEILQLFNESEDIINNAINNLIDNNKIIKKDNNYKVIN